MKNINKSSIHSLIFAVVFIIVGILRFNVNNWIDTGFYILAVIGFVIMFFATNKKNK